MDVPHAVSAPIPPYPQISADSQRSSSFIKPHQPSSTTRHFFLEWVEAKRDYRLKPGSFGSDLATDGGPLGARGMPGLDRDQSR